MNSKSVFISSADSNYYPMLREWAHSIRRFPQSRDMDICILDVGMTPEQHEQVKPHVTHIIKPDWPKKIPAHRIKGRNYYKACVNRPFLKDFFPGYDLYFWMDADTWIQEWRAIDMFIKGAQRMKLSITAAVDRSYPRAMRVKWIGAWPWKVRGFYMTNARKAHGMTLAKKLFAYHNLSAGSFCLHKDAPHWEKWQDNILKTLEKGKVFTAEQLSLGMTIHLDGLPVEILPSYMHWFCQFKPLWDVERQIFVEPYLPHEPIGILHLSGYDKMRIDRSVLTDFKTTDGQMIDYTYRYPHFNGETGEACELFPAAA